MQQAFVHYLENVEAVLEQHAIKCDVLAQLLQTSNQISQSPYMPSEQVQEVLLNAITAMQEHAQQLREHGGYIREVIEQPHLLSVC